MIFVYAALFLLCLYKVKISVKPFNTDGYLAMDSTNSVRGLFVMLVLFSHFMQYYTYTAPIDIMGGRISKELGQLIVVMFMFYSGYGVCESIKKKGAAYVKTFPKNRVLKTFVHFDIAVLLFLVMDILIGKTPAPKKILLSLLCWDNIGNSNWYIFAVIVLYAATWLAFTVFRKNNVLAAGATTLLIGAYIIIMKQYQDYWWYDTVLCYALGMWFSLGKEKIQPLIAKNNIVWAIFALALLAALRYCHYISTDLIWRIAEALTFAAAYVVISLKVTINNKILVWLGKHTFEIYILMRAPMKLFGMLGLGKINVYLYFFVCLVSTLLLAWGFGKLMGLLDKALFKKPAISPKKA